MAPPIFKVNSATIPAVSRYNFFGCYIFHHLVSLLFKFSLIFFCCYHLVDVVSLVVIFVSRYRFYVKFFYIVFSC
jgi:hypothetical protein